MERLASSDDRYLPSNNLAHSHYASTNARRAASPTTHPRATTPTNTLAIIDAQTPASPRSIPGGEKSRDRRAGLVFHDAFNAAPAPASVSASATYSDISQPILSDDNEVSSTLQYRLNKPPSPQRPRTRTLEDHGRHRQYPAAVSRSNHRIGSAHTADIPTVYDARKDITASSDLSLDSLSETQPTLPDQRPTTTRVKSSHKLQRGNVERSSSPLAPSPSIPFDLLSTPLGTSNANRVLKIMRTLNGRMRGPVEFQTLSNGGWTSGLCYIDDTRGSLIFEGDDRTSSHSVVVADLRGCRVRPATSTERQMKCLEISIQDVIIRIVPLLATEFDHWLAAMLYWQQTKPGKNLVSLIPASSDFPERMTMPRSTSSKSMNKDVTIIKVGKVAFWDIDAPPTNSSVPHGSLSQSNGGSWQKVSCILQDNGVFKLLREDDIIVLLVIQLNQLSRCAIQRLDRSVLGKEYAIGIFPYYTSTSTSISIFRPIYIALDQRVLFEVWFVLLRAFAIPEMYENHALSVGDDAFDIRHEGEDDEDDAQQPRELFRIDRLLSIRVVEAKIRGAAKPPHRQDSRRSDRSEQDHDVGNYLTEVHLDGEVRARTACKEDTRSPFWREECELQDVPSSTSDLTFVLVRRTSLMHDRRKSDDSANSPLDIDTRCGVVVVRLDQLDVDGEDEKWWPILNDTQEKIGEMFLKIRFQEIVVLPARDYQKLSELLHRFNNGLTLQLAQHTVLNLKQLAEILMNIFQVSGQSHEWLTTLVEDEIDGVGKDAPPNVRYRFSKRLNSASEETHGATVVNRELAVRDMSKSLAGEANLLFRGNSLLTQALDFHMRRLGKDYLEEVLADKIAEIDALDADCEVDPSRISQGQDLSKHWTQLISLTTGVWESISVSAQRCPPGLRHILKYVRAVADDRYGEFLRTVPYTSVSGFLFLRFFCPALLNPKVFDLLRDHPKPRSQRTLTLIAKSLQVLANLSTFGQKEAWMEPMNRFLSSHRQDVKTYIDTITSIPGASQALALPASYSTPITILGRLPPTSREGFPSLPHLIDHARNFAALVKLWLDTTTQHLAHFAPGKTDGDLQEFHELCLALQGKANECLQRADSNDNGVDVETGAMRHDFQWDDLVTSLDQFTTKPLDLASALQTSNYHATSVFPTPSTTGFSAISSTPFLPIVAFDGPIVRPSSPCSQSSIYGNNTGTRPPGSSSSADTMNMGTISSMQILRGGSSMSQRIASEGGRPSDVESFIAPPHSSIKERKERKERGAFWEIRSAFHHHKEGPVSSGASPSPDKTTLGRSIASSGLVTSPEQPRSSTPPLGWGARQLDKLENVKIRDRDREGSKSSRRSEDILSEFRDKDKDESRRAPASGSGGFLGLGALRKRIEAEKEREREREGSKEKVRDTRRKMSASSANTRFSDDRDSVGTSGGLNGNWL